MNVTRQTLFEATQLFVENNKPEQFVCSLAEITIYAPAENCWPRLLPKVRR